MASVQSIEKIVENLVRFWQETRHLWTRFKNVTEADVELIYKQPGDAEIDISTMTYDFDLPLYCKMVFRHRNNEGNSNLGFYSGCDPSNKSKLLRWAGFTFRNLDMALSMCDLFLYISCELFHGISLDKDGQDALDKMRQFSSSIDSWNSFTIKMCKAFARHYARENFNYVQAFLDESDSSSDDDTSIDRNEPETVDDLIFSLSKIILCSKK
jgi:hypothetical protein